MRGLPKSSILLLAGGLSFLALPGAVAGQERIELGRLSGPIELDGFSDEAAWREIDPLPMVMHWPNFRGEMTERTEIRIAYDDHHIYAAGRFYDDPEGIRGISLYRDRWNGDDAFDLIIDSFNDDETALKFTTTPLGIMLDHEIRNDAEFGGGERPLNVEWDGFWDVAVQTTREGWFAEMRIPFSSLGFSASDGRAVMGVIASRYISRKDETHVFPMVPPNWELAKFKPSKAQDVVLSDVADDPPLYITPYVLAGVERTRTLEAPVGPPDTDLSQDVGLDAKYGLSNNLTLDLTVNTDFAETESDAQVVNLTRFNLFFPEKRQFFQERSSVFEFNTGDEGRLFHSRRIGLTSEGEPMNVLGGLRLAGRVGEWDIGVLDMQVDDGHGQPGENAGVVRVRRGLFGDASSAGAMVTSRITTNGRRDLAYGLDASVRPFGEDHLTLQWAQSFDSAEEGPAAFADRALARLFWERPSLDGLGYQIDVARSGPAYDPGLGFEERDDFSAFKTNFTYAWQPGSDSPFSRHKAWLTSRLFLRNDDGSIQSGLQRFRWSTDFRGGNFLNIALNFEYEDLAETLDLDDGVFVPAGSYFGPNLFTYYSLSRSRALGGEAIMHVGTFLDGWRTRLDLRPRWVVSPHLALNLEYNINRLWFPSRGQRFDADVARLRIQAALDTRLSAEALVQYNRAAERIAGNLRVRYRFAEGRELVLIVDETRDLGPLDEELAPAGPTDRRLLLKYEYTFQP